jgi:hypothetical protein
MIPECSRLLPVSPMSRTVIRLVARTSRESIGSGDYIGRMILGDRRLLPVSSTSVNLAEVGGQEVKEQQELEAKISRDRRSFIPTSSFTPGTGIRQMVMRARSSRNWSPRIMFLEDRRPLLASSSSVTRIRQVATRSRSSRSWDIRDSDKVGSEEKEQQEQEALKNDRMALLFCLPQGRSRIQISARYFGGSLLVRGKTDRSFVQVQFQ